MTRGSEFAALTSRRTEASQSDRLRILFVAHRYLPQLGGTELHTSEVARRLAAQGHDVTVLTTDLLGTLPPTDDIDGVTVIRVSTWRWARELYIAPAIRSAIRYLEPDIVHCQGFHTLVAPTAMHSAYRSRLPYVLTFHSGGHSSLVRRSLQWPQCWLLRPLFQRAERLIAVSEFEAALFERALRLSGATMSVIPSGANIANNGGALEVETDDNLIISVGRLERYKGHHRVVAALPYVLRARPNSRLLLLGSGPYRTALERLAAKLGCSDRVLMRSIPVADRESLAQLIKSAAVVTVLSTYESQGIAAVEAAYLGRPLLVAESSALRELVRDGIARGIPPRSGPAEVAEAILQQLSDPMVPSRVALPTWEGCVEALVEMYRSIISQRVSA